MDILMLLSCQNHEHLSIFMLLPSCLYTYVRIHLHIHMHIYRESFLPIGMCLYLVQNNRIKFFIPAAIQFLILTFTNWDVTLPLLSEVISKNIQKWESQRRNSEETSLFSSCSDLVIAPCPYHTKGKTTVVFIGTFPSAPYCFVSSLLVILFPSPVAFCCFQLGTSLFSPHTQITLDAIQEQWSQ